MDSHEDDRPLGLPVMKPRSKDDTSPPEEPALGGPESQTIDLGRHPADELGLPKQIPSQMRAPTEEELAAIERGTEAEAMRLYAQVVEESTLSQFNDWRRWTDRTLLLAILALVALFALFVFAQTVQILAVLAVQALPIKMLGYAGLIAILAILIVFMGRLLLIFVRLRVNQQISAIQLQELSRRAELRALVQRDKSAAKKNLESYLRSYPLDEGRVREVLGTLRVDDNTIKKLRDARDFLLDHDRFADYDSWLGDFQERFQNSLQDAADKVVTRWMKLVGIKTAISPNPMVDSAVVLYCSYGMIGDLCRLYNLRMTGPGMTRLLALGLFNTYAAGQLEDHLGTLSDAALNVAQRLDLQPFLDAMNTYTFGLSGLTGNVVLPKAVDGAANALLMRKLGRATIKMLSPVTAR